MGSLNGRTGSEKDLLISKNDGYLHNGVAIDIVTDKRQ